MRRTLFLCAAVATGTAAQAHEGHGLAMPHLHGHEWGGLLLVAVGLGLWWWSRRGGR